jgi:polysaccharide pyruvyl transferase WcaK-like protein
VRSHRKQSVEGVRVGLFGLLGSGNTGNDAAMEAVVRYLRERHPSAVIDVMCSGPKRVTTQYGLQADQMFWFDIHQNRLSSRPWNLLRVPSRILDVFRVPGWVRRHDVVIVPGSGVLEATLPLRPWDTPYGLFLLTASGRLFRTKTAMVCVGAAPISKRTTRALSDWAARLATYRSYRDIRSREEMRRRGLDTGDPVFNDLVYSLPTPRQDRSTGGDWSTIGVGVMAYVGSNDDRDRASDVYRSYVDRMTEVVCGLVDDARKVRLFIGDTDGSDDATARAIITAVRELRPHVDETWVTAAQATTLSEIIESMEPLGAIIATRFHNLVAALKLAKPTISVGYSDKHHALMTAAGLGMYSHPVESFDADVVIAQLRDMEQHEATLRQSLLAHTAQLAEQLQRQFDELDDALFGRHPVRSSGPVPIAEDEHAGTYQEAHRRLRLPVRW